MWGWSRGRTSLVCHPKAISRLPQQILKETGYSPVDLDTLNSSPGGLGLMLRLIQNPSTSTAIDSSRILRVYFNLCYCLNNSETISISGWWPMLFFMPCERCIASILDLARCLHTPDPWEPDKIIIAPRDLSAYFNLLEAAGHRARKSNR